MRNTRANHPTVIATFAVMADTVPTGCRLKRMLKELGRGYGLDCIFLAGTWPTECNDIPPAEPSLVTTNKETQHG